MNLKQLVIRIVIFIFIFLLSGCNERENLTIHHEIPVTLHIVNQKGEPIQGVEVTIMKIAKSDAQPVIERGQILGKTDGRGNIYWADGSKGNYFVLLNKNGMPVSYEVSLTKEKKKSSITLLLND